MNALEEAGFSPTGEFTQLNSYENRVYDLQLEKAFQANHQNIHQNISRIVAKFYRPGRWSVDALKEEHEFLFDLQKEGVPVVAPLQFQEGKSLLSFAGMNVAFFPKFSGRMPEEFLGDDLYQVGRRLAQIHNVGARKDFKHRAVIGEFPFSMEDNLDLLMKWVAPEVRDRYEDAVLEVIDVLRESLDFDSFIRIHGDCHRGNLLQAMTGTLSPTGSPRREFFFVDFDDSAMGPEVQDFWMLFSGIESQDEQDLILSGYEELREFPHSQMALIPWLRGLRIFTYAAWIARRWDDPSFPKLFPEFNSYTYWAEETEALEAIAWSRS